MFNRKNRRRLAAGFILVLMGIWALHGGSGYTAGELMQENGGQILKLTPVANDSTGGTGFLIQAPSGDVFTMTNRHICQLGRDGKLEAHWDNSERIEVLNILEVHETADLCILTGVPGASGLILADELTWYDTLTAIGHPLLKPLTIAQGWAISRGQVDIVDPDLSEAECSAEGGKPGTVSTPFGPLVICQQSFDGIETSIIAYPGNSGSPVFNPSGGVVGVIFASSSGTNWGVMVPLDTVQKMLAVY